MSEEAVVFDASAVLALLHEEKGADEVYQKLVSSKMYMSTVNYCEVASKFDEVGKDVEAFKLTFDSLGIQQVPFDQDLALECAKLRRKTRQLGLSIGDRACLSLARKLRVPAITADKAWSNLPDDFRVVVFR